MKLSNWAKKQGVSYRTAWNLFKAWKIKNSYKLPSGTIIVKDEENQDNKTSKVVIYARVSSLQNRNNLDTQADRLTQYCLARGYIISETIKEIGSWLNDKRPKLIKILSDKEVTRIVVEHKDRLSRVGFNYVKTLCNFHWCEIEVVNPSADDKEDLIQDFISVITSFCARIYGQRRSKRNTEQLIKQLTNDKSL